MITTITLCIYLDSHNANEITLQYISNILIYNDGSGGGSTLFINL